jgi:hypothetical protein
MAAEDAVADVQQAAQGLALEVLGVRREELAGVLEHDDLPAVRRA